MTSLTRMNIFNLLIPFFSFIQNIFRHGSLLFHSTTPSSLFAFFAFAEFKTKKRLSSFYMQIWQNSFQKFRGNSVSGAINIHFFISMKSIFRTINFGIPGKSTTKFVLKHFNNMRVRHFNLNSFTISRRLYVWAISHSPCRTLNSNISFAINNTCKISTKLFFTHTSLIPHMGGEVKGGGGL